MNAEIGPCPQIPTESPNFVNQKSGLLKRIQHQLESLQSQSKNQLTDEFIKELTGLQSRLQTCSDEETLNTLSEQVDLLCPLVTSSSAEQGASSLVGEITSPRSEQDRLTGDNKTFYKTLFKQVEKLKKRSQGLQDVLALSIDILNSKDDVANKTREMVDHLQRALNQICAYNLPSSPTTKQFNQRQSEFDTIHKNIKIFKDSLQTLYLRLKNEVAESIPLGTPNRPDFTESYQINKNEGVVNEFIRLVPELLALKKKLIASEVPVPAVSVPDAVVLSNQEADTPQNDTLITVTSDAGEVAEPGIVTPEAVSESKPAQHESVPEYNQQIQDIDNDINKLIDDESVPLFTRLADAQLDKHPQVRSAKGVLSQAADRYGVARANFNRLTQENPSDSEKLKRSFAIVEKQALLLQKTIAYHVEKLNKLLSPIQETAIGATAEGVAASTVKSPKPSVPDAVIEAVESVKPSNSIKPPESVSEFVERSAAEIVELSLAEKYQYEREKIANDLEHLKKTPNLPSHVEQWLQQATDSHIVDLAGISYNETTRYIPLRDKLQALVSFTKVFSQAQEKVASLHQEAVVLKHQLPNIRVESLADESAADQAYVRSAITSALGLQNTLGTIGEEYSKTPTSTTLNSMTQTIETSLRDVENEIATAKDRLAKYVQAPLVLTPDMLVENEKTEPAAGAVTTSVVSLGTTPVETTPTNVVPPPRVGGVAIELRPDSVRDSKNTERVSRIRAFWNRLPQAAKAAVIATFALFANTEKAGQYAEGFNPTPTVGAPLVPSAWTTAGAAGNSPVANVEGVNMQIHVPVRPYTRQIAVAEQTVVPSAEVVVNIPETPIPPRGEFGVGSDVVPSPDKLVPPSELQTTADDPMKIVSAAPALITLDPSLVREEAVVTGEAKPTANMIEVRSGKENIHTLPDNAVDTVFATVDTSGLPVVLVNRVWNEEKYAFLNNRERLIKAGVKSGDKNVTLPGEKIDYTDPKNAFEQRIAELRMYLNVPHTEVVLEGSNLTQTTLRSYDTDLRVIPESARLQVVEDALREFLKIPNALGKLKLQDKDNILAGTVAYLGDLAPYIAISISKYTKVQLAKTQPKSVEIAGAESKERISVTEPVNASSQPLSPETYPGGVLKYSADYNQLLTSLGIDPVPPTVIAFDSWFTPKKPDNRAILDMSVGDLTTLMLRTPGEIVQELSLLQIDPKTADRIYRVIQDLRRAHFGKFGTGEEMTIKDALAHYVLDTVPRRAG